MNFPNEKVDEWYGFTRHIFPFEGYDAWVVEPVSPAAGRPWSWCMEWPEAFCRRVGIVDLLARGWHHVHIHVPGYANDATLPVYRRFQDFLNSELGLAAGANLIGMSLGGLYSLRYAMKNPEAVERIYLDAPVCNFHLLARLFESYGLKSDADVVADDPRMPVNFADGLTHIPMLLIYGADDLTVDPRHNCELFAGRFRRHGGEITVIKREYWGHHPHGLDDTAPIREFFTGQA